VIGNVIPVPGESYQLGDRVVCCSMTHTVPMGLRGYIIGKSCNLVPGTSLWPVLREWTIPLIGVIYKIRFNVKNVVVY